MKIDFAFLTFCLLHHQNTDDYRKFMTIVIKRTLYFTSKRGPIMPSFSFILEEEAEKNQRIEEHLHSYFVQVLLYTH